ncbi:MAG TPA: amino acid adenylation domain-containing protein, partial [Thermoanaerobaculia bacterium]|nr:amino acid adenylation domain-containing protein [Thermoanaerobaculia bacterium]
LGLQVDQQGDDWTLHAEYAADLFEAATVRRWLGHLRVLLEGIAASPDTRISELPLLTPEEIEELGSWNRTEAEVPREPVHRLFRLWAERAPDALAVEWDGGRLTYGELARRADGLVSRLRAQGVGPETVVALRLERSPELVTAVLAVLEAGGAYLPIDPANPEERVRWILEDSGALTELTAETLTPLPLSRGGGWEGGSGDGGEELAYVIYTSGSTGTPKGTELRHRGLSNLIAWHRRTFGLGPSDRTTLVSSPGFDNSVLEIWTALTSGASLHVPSRDTILSPSALLAWTAEQRITVMLLPTPLAEAVLAEAAVAKLPEDLALRALLTGGDRLRSRPAPGVPFELINFYGPTESTVDATAGRVAAHGERAPDIGAPIANTRVHVLDRNLRLVPVGVAGELCLAGEGLARAYRGRPDLTAERFVPNPFPASGGLPGERLYRSGDLACWLPDGNLQFLGRIDHQVKIRGFRIELGEIETVLLQYPGVREAVVAAREDRPDDRRLVAYYVPEHEQEPSSGQLRAWLRGKLPEFMVPAAFVPLGVLPLTPSGKIDRRALPAPVSGPVAPAAAPRTPLESLVAGVCSEILGIEEVPRDVSFFDLGGNSLMATQIVTLLQDVLPVELNLRQVLERPTVARMAEIVEEEHRALAEPERLAMDEILAELERSLAPG